MTVIDYPDTPPAYGPSHRLAYDSMGRLSGVKDFNNADIVNNVTYGPAGQLLTLSWMNYTETRQYNNLLQMTRLTAAGGSQGSLDLEYKFSSTQNNGRITAMKDWVTGEEVQYTYDALQRLTRAETVGPEWGSTYGYDGFGNLLQKNPVKGSGVPLLNIAVDPGTNRVSGLSGGSYDANGNDLTAGAFDIANRLKQSGSTYFQHDAANKRVWKGTVAGGAITSEEFYFYAPWGAKLAAYKPTNYLNVTTMTIVSSNEYFGGKLIKINGVAILTDRLDSNISNGKRYFPYGEERGSTANNIEKFGTYFRDTETTLDYADQRYYKWSSARFSSTDPLVASASIGDSTSWNRYAYVSGDPVNSNDPSGLLATKYTSTTNAGSRNGDPNDPQPLPVTVCQINGVWLSGEICNIWVRRGRPVFVGDSAFEEFFYRVRPECDPRRSENRPYLDFIDSFSYAAFFASRTVNVDPVIILAWSALEVDNGIGPTVRNGNFFGLTSSGAQWDRSDVCPVGSYPGFACFGGDQFSQFVDSAIGAFQSFRGRYGNIVRDGLRDGLSLESIFRAVGAAGWCAGDPRCPGYGASFTARYEEIKKRMDCRMMSGGSSSSGIGGVI